MAAQARMQSTFSCPIDISKSERDRLLRAPYFLGAPLALKLWPKIKSAAHFKLSKKIRNNFCLGFCNHFFKAFKI